MVFVLLWEPLNLLVGQGEHKDKQQNTEESILCCENVGNIIQLCQFTLNMNELNLWRLENAA